MNLHKNLIAVGVLMSLYSSDTFSSNSSKETLFVMSKECAPATTPRCDNFTADDIDVDSSKSQRTEFRNLELEKTTAGNTPAHIDNLSFSPVAFGGGDFITTDIVEQKTTRQLELNWAMKGRRTLMPINELKRKRKSDRAEDTVNTPDPRDDLWNDQMGIGLGVMTIANIYFAINSGVASVAPEYYGIIRVGGELLRYGFSKRDTTDDHLVFALGTVNGLYNNLELAKSKYSRKEVFVNNMIACNVLFALRILGNEYLSSTAFKALTLQSNQYRTSLGFRIEF